MIDVVVAHYNEDIGWTEHIDKNRFRVIIVSKTKQDADIYIDVNKGFEASAYLRYMHDYYDQLPEHMVFVHGQNTSWHHHRSLKHIINSLAFEDEGIAYHNINSPMPNTFVCDGVEVPDGNHVIIAGLQKWRSCIDIFLPLVLDPQPTDFRCKICAQFVVSRDLIHRHSKDMYLNWYEKLMSDTRDSKTLACVWEWSWCLVLTGCYDELSMHHHRDVTTCK